MAASSSAPMNSTPPSTPSPGANPPPPCTPSAMSPPFRPASPRTPPLSAKSSPPPDGRNVYAGNRVADDTIAVFRGRPRPPPPPTDTVRTRQWQKRPSHRPRPHRPLAHHLPPEQQRSCRPRARPQLRKALPTGPYLSSQQADVRSLCLRNRDGNFSYQILPSSRFT